MGRVVLTYAVVLAAVYYWDNRFTESVKQPIEALGIMFGLPVVSLWLDEWIG